MVKSKFLSWNLKRNTFYACRNTFKNTKTNMAENLEDKFMTAARFSQDVEKLVLNNSDMNYIDAVIHYCEINEIELESVSKLVSKPLKEKLKYDAQKLNFMKKTSRAKLMLV